MGVRRQGVDPVARPLRTEYVTGNYFTTLGVGAFGGRVFTAEDDTPSAPPVVVISHHTWQNEFGGDRTVVGSTFVIDGHPFMVVGVTPPGFFGETLRSSPPDIWIPIQHEPLLNEGGGLLRQPSAAWLRLIGRVGRARHRRGRPAADRRAAAMAAARSGLSVELDAGCRPQLPRQVIAIVPAGGGVGVMKEQYSESLEILLAVCGLVLLIVCANVANLLLARAAARRTQTAVRLAVGAARRHLVAQALVESVLLSLAGGLAGLFVAVGAARLLLSLAFTTSTFLPISAAPSPLVLACCSGSRW